MMSAKNHRPLRGTLRLDEPLARHTSWRLGGPADRFYVPADSADLVAFLERLPVDEPLFWLGLGSNLLVRDGGLRGTVICTSGALSTLTRVDAERVRVEVGVACPKVAKFCARGGLCGAEFLAGIPGTLGGALAMNAGAFGGETWACVERVETIDRLGRVRARAPRDFAVAYRSVQGPEGEWFLAGVLHLQPGEVQAGQERIKALLARRGASQPTRQASAGSVFRNPPGDHAARLIEASGLKGQCRGGACVSDKHANFIINTGTATSAEVEALIAEVATAVEVRHGVRLQREVCIVGDARHAEAPA